MKKFRTLLLLLVAVLILSLGAFAVTACSNDKNPAGPGPVVPGPDDEIDESYKAVYDLYKEAATAAGQQASSLEDWYTGISSRISAISVGGATIADIDVEEINDVDYIVITYDGGRKFVEELLGGNGFKEAVTFTIAPTDGDNPITSGIYLDVTLEGGDKVATVNVGNRGTEDLILIGESTSEYIITVSEKSSAAYGFAMGYEPHFAMSDEQHTVEFAVQAASDMVTHEVTVNCRAEGDWFVFENIELTLTYAEGDAAEGIIIDKQTTDSDGKATFTFYAHEGSDYVVIVNNDTLTEEMFMEPTEPFALDLASPTGSTVTLERFKHYDPEKTVQATITPTKAEDFNNRDVVTISLSSANVSKVSKVDDHYEYEGAVNGKLYVALDMVIPGINAEKSIKGLLEEDEDYFTCEHLISEDDNTWQVWKYKEMLQAYMPYLNEKGLYPLNDDLYNFINDKSIQELYATQSEYALLIPLVYYSEDKLAVGGTYEQYSVNIPKGRVSGYNSAWNPSVYTALAKKSVNLVDSTPDGWYVISVKIAKFTEIGRMVVFTKSSNNFAQRINSTDPTYETNFSTLQITKVTEGDGAPYYEGKALIYLGGTIGHTLTLLHDVADSVDVNVKLEKVDSYPEYAALKDCGRPYLHTGEMEVFVFPDAWITGEDVASRINYENKSTFGYTFDLNRVDVKYRVIPTITSDLDSVKVYRFKKNKESTPAMTYSPVVTAQNGVEINASATDPIKRADNGRYGMVFTHSGSEIKKMKIKVTAEYTTNIATYKPGDGAEGETYVHYLGTAPGGGYLVLDVTNSSMKYTKEGYTFCGWSYTEDGGGEVIYLPGQTFTVPDHDFEFTAVWKKDTENLSADALDVGSNVTLKIDGEKYTTNVVRFANAVTSDKAYMLTLTTTTDEWGGWLMTLGGKKVTLLEISTDSGHKYVTFIARGKDVEGLVIYTPYKDAPLDVTFSLEEYSPLSITPDGETEYIVPLAPGDGENLLPLEMKIGEGSLTAGCDYKFSFVDASVKSSVGYITLVADVMADSATYLGRTLFISSSTSFDFALEATATKLYLINAGSGSTQPTVYGVAKIKIAREYTVSYEIGEAGETGNGGTGSVNSVRFKAEGDSVTLDNGSGFSWASHVFVYWVMKGDSGETPYYGGTQFEMPDHDVTFVAKWRVEKIQEIAFDMSAGGYTAEQETQINPDEDTSFSLKVTGMQSFRTGTYFVFDLGTSNYNGEIVLNIAASGLPDPGTPNNRKVVLTHSDVLSSLGHNVFTSYDMTTQGSISSMAYTLDLKAWAIADNPVIKNIKVKLAVPSSYLKENANGDIAGNIAVKNTLYDTSDTAYKYVYFPTNLFNGATYKLHIQFHSNAGNVTQVSLCKYRGFGKNPATKDYKITADPNDPNHYISDEFELVGNSDNPDLDTRSLCISMRSNAGFYTADVWAEKIKDAPAVEGEKLSLTHSVNIKVTKDSPVTVAVDDTSVKPGVAYNIKVNQGADIKIGLMTLVTKATVSNYTPNASNRYEIRNITFGDRTFTVSTTSDEEQNISLILSEFKAIDITTSEDGNIISLPASPADIDVIMSSNGSAVNYYKMTITGKTGGLADGVVIKLISDSVEYTFNKANNWTVESVRIYIAPMIMWSENGAVEIKATVKKYENVINNSGSSYVQNVDMTGDKTTFEADYVLGSNFSQKDASAKYCFIIKFVTKNSRPTAKTMTCTITIGDKTIHFPEPPTNGLWYSTDTIDCNDVGPNGAVAHLKIVDDPRTNTVSNASDVQIYLDVYKG